MCPNNHPSLKITEVSSCSHACHNERQPGLCSIFINDPKHPGMLFAEHMDYTCVEAVAFNIPFVPHFLRYFHFFFVHYLYDISLEIPGAFVGGGRESVEIGGGREMGGVGNPEGGLGKGRDGKGRWWGSRGVGT